MCYGVTTQEKSIERPSLSSLIPQTTNLIQDDCKCKPPFHTQFYFLNCTTILFFKPNSHPKAQQYTISKPILLSQIDNNTHFKPNSTFSIAQQYAISNLILPLADT